jgi:drug/metabolite transporter (DMT)-like permease
MSRPSRHLLEIHGAVLLFGLAGLFGKLLDLSPALIALGRVVFATLALLAVAGPRRLRLGPRPGRSLLAFAALGALLAAHWTTFFASVQAASVAVALITFATFPVFVAFLEPAFFRERLRAADVFLALAALAGVVILVPDFDLADGTTQGVCWGVASGLTFALLALLNRRYVRQHSSITIALYQDAFAAVALLPLAVLGWRSLGGEELLLLLVLGVLCTAVAHSLFIAGLRGVRARTASMIACLEPVYGTALAAALLGELPSVRTLLGGAVVLGVAFYATLTAGDGEVGRKEVPG